MASEICQDSAHISQNRSFASFTFPSKNTNPRSRALRSFLQPYHILKDLIAKGRGRKDRLQAFISFLFPACVLAVVQATGAGGSPVGWCLLRGQGAVVRGSGQRLNLGSCPGPATEDLPLQCRTSLGRVQVTRTNWEHLFPAPSSESSRGSLKLAIAQVFTSWKSAKSTNQDPTANPFKRAARYACTCARWSVCARPSCACSHLRAFVGSAVGPPRQTLELEPSGACGDGKGL